MTLDPRFVSELERICTGGVFSEPADTLAYECDGLSYLRAAPSAVVLPASAAQVQAVVRLCHRAGVPFVARGHGTGLSGGAMPIAGGIVIGLGRLNRVLDVDIPNRRVTVEPGVTNLEITRRVAPHGFYFAPDPSSQLICSIGGNIATNSGGLCCVKYGVTTDYVRGLEVVLASGEVMRTGRRTVKGVAGYDLTRLFVGSEGTLGVITEVTVRLYPQPEAISAAICNFESVDAAVESVIEIIQSGVPVARVELIDTMGVKAVNAYSKLTLRESPLLLFEFHGSATGVREQAATVQEITRAHGGTDFEWAERPEDRNRLWTARHNAYFATLQLRPGSRSVTTDVCVPISRLAECVHATNEDLARGNIVSAIVGHVGDGNFHVQLLIDPNDPAERAAAEAINHRLVARALAMDGTCTGEHGVGLHKMEFLADEHGADALELMRAIKHALDPHGILNPGKVIRA